MIMENYYVSATDKIFSGWGKARNQISKFVVICDDEEQVEKTKTWMERNSCFTRISVSRKEPYFSPRVANVQTKHYNDCPAIHRV